MKITITTDQFASFQVLGITPQVYTMKSGHVDAWWSVGAHSVAFVLDDDGLAEQDILAANSNAIQVVRIDP